MPTMPASILSRHHSAAKRSERIDLRILPEVRSLIDHAAELTGKKRSDFILDAARAAAEMTLLDRRTIPLDKEAYSAFIALLDAPPQPNANLRTSLTTPAVWE